ncbi:hypothetical protein [Erythrobacter litoralis]|uniref:Uncharacterized protein n=1 Tax=Erythrobacter litoralis (strain HTCC2594) TaxID=314225 RepID=Q2NC91_ERYLH|nr:hypothetical protein [Erythrobacter litoralis]ABC62700.1 hypothetical protein ELI_03040 [Erythrobacter litoralis HTCC2594]
MTLYKLLLPADDTGTAHSFEIEARTPWLAVEKSRGRIGPDGAEIYQGKKCLGRVRRVTSGRSPTWMIDMPEAT